MASVEYDKTDALSLESYAKGLIGYTFYDVMHNKVNSSREMAMRADAYGDPKRKGGLGNLIEEVYFGYKANSISEADFPEAGVELKVTVFEEKKDGELRAGERLVLSMINYNGPIEETLEESHMWQKCRQLLLIYYLRDKNIKDNLQFKICFASLFTPKGVDLKIIEEDYRYIAGKVQSGTAEELSEADTKYLGACTKGANAEKSIVKQWYPPYKPAKKRAFCYKNSYMTFVLNEYIAPVKTDYQNIINNPAVLEENSFEQIIIGRIKKYVGMTDKEICQAFGETYTRNKAQWTTLAYRMLGIKNNKAEEFAKANISVRVIRIESNGNMAENMSLPAFKYKELAKEEWEDSTLKGYFEETRFFFVVFKNDGTDYRLKGCQFWNMPYRDIETIVRPGWNKIVDVIRRGVELEMVETKNGVVIRNNFPSIGDNAAIHIRPHASKRYYRFNNGTVIGNGTEADANPLPDGTWMPNYSFWLNNTYILSQLNADLK